MNGVWGGGERNENNGGEDCRSKNEVKTCVGYAVCSHLAAGRQLVSIIYGRLQFWARHPLYQPLSSRQDIDHRL